MNQDSASPGDARAMQLKLYREIGISAVAAALQPAGRPDRAPRGAEAVDKGSAKPQVTPKRAA